MLYTIKSTQRTDKGFYLSDDSGFNDDHHTGKLLIVCHWTTQLSRAYTELNPDDITNLLKNYSIAGELYAIPDDHTWDHIGIKFWND